MTLDLQNLFALRVSLHGRRIGTLTRLAGDRQLFAFDQDYVDDTGRPTLSLSCKGRAGDIIGAPRPVSRRVPPFFSNLLPEGHLRNYLARQAGVNPEREFFLLAALGADLAGAVTVTPLDKGGLEIDPLGAGNRGGHSSGAGTDTRPDRALRFSLAGVQLKFSALAEASGGLTIPADGVGGSWIVKLPSQAFDAVSENEFVMLDLARAVGIAVPRNLLVPVREINGLPIEAGAIKGRALAVERFDRAPDGTRIHMEDFAQVFGVFPENKYRFVSYSNMARVLWAETGEPGAYGFLSRLAFAVLTGNADMHLKNCSILYPGRRTPSLAPAYDLVSTLPYIPADGLALTFGGARDITRITAEQIRRFADKAGMPVAPSFRIVREMAESVLDQWKALPSRDLLPPAILNAIDSHLQAAARTTLAETKN